MWKLFSPLIHVLLIVASSFWSRGPIVAAQGPSLPAVWGQFLVSAKARNWLTHPPRRPVHRKPRRMVSLRVCGCNPRGAGPMGNVALEKLCERFGCDPRLVSAIVSVESGWNPYAVRYEPNYQWLHEPMRHAKRHGITLQTEAVLQRCSWGLMQVMGSTSREIGLVLPIPALCEPLVGLEYGIRYLNVLKRNYKNQEDLIAAYNAGTAKKKPDGTYENQRYVDKVRKAMKEAE